jgi:putative DNA primase/helicase
VLRSGVRELAKGKWAGILVRLGVEEKYLKNSHGPCPICGGTDRYRFDDKNGTGSYFCSSCRSGDGIQLLMAVKGWGFATAAKAVEEQVGFVRAEDQPAKKSDEAKKAALRRIWTDAHRLTGDDEVSKYLKARGLILPESSIRCHESLLYREEGIDKTFPAMLGLISQSDGTAASIHRTYILNGEKAPVDSPKKLMAGMPVKGAAIRLFRAGPCVGIAEGIETAIACFMRFAIPTWSAVSAIGMESWQPPKGIEKVVIFGDNDASFTGQASAYALAKRLRSDFKVEVRIPQTGDWADGV